MSETIDPDTGEIVDPGQAGGERDRSFAHFIELLEDGHLNPRLSKLLRDLNAALHDHILDAGVRKAKGSLTLKLDFELKDGAFEVQAEAKTVLPKASHPRSIMWSTEGNNFVNQNPRQLRMPFQTRTVDGGESVRVVS